MTCTFEKRVLDYTLLLKNRKTKLVHSSYTSMTLNIPLITHSLSKHYIFVLFTIPIIDCYVTSEWLRVWRVVWVCGHLKGVWVCPKRVEGSSSCCYNIDIEHLICYEQRLHPTFTRQHHRNADDLMKTIK